MGNSLASPVAFITSNDIAVNYPDWKFGGAKVLRQYKTKGDPIMSNEFMPCRTASTVGQSMWVAPVFMEGKNENLDVVARNSRVSYLPHLHFRYHVFSFRENG